MVTTVFYIEGLLGQSKRTECIHHDRQFGSFGLADRAFVGPGVRAMRNAARVQGQITP